jgi:protein involved in polysaccharide export with SLBB domain
MAFAPRVFALNLCWPLLLVLAGVFSGCVNPATPSSIARPDGLKTEENSVGRYSDFVFKPGDLLTVSIRKSSSISPSVTSARINDPAGTYHLPSVGTLQVVGESARQLQAEIRANVRPNWLVSVVTPCTCLTYGIAGEVNDPGPKFHGPGLTVLKAVEAAGGVTKFGDQRRITLLREGGQRMTINLEHPQKSDLKVLP